MTIDADCVKVAVRIRPLVKSELDKGCQNIIEKIPGEPQVLVRNSDTFTFNYVFSPDDTQQYVYETAVCGMLEKLFKGYNVTILAYGQTGSGKTHTMGTTFNGSFDATMGVIPRVVSDIFEKISTMSVEYKVTVTCSFVELYQEQLYDLLSKNSREQSVVDIREDGSRGIIIPGLTESPVTTANETTDCLMKGSSGRAVGATAMNAQSSRSHAIFTVTIQMNKKNDPNAATTSKFHLVDLAGSERAQKTKATGDRFKEGVKINQGLLALGNVISALGSGQGSGYVGYRDSKLTRLLQDSLGGNSVTLMIACVSPADYNLDETLSTLRYADRARKIKNKPVVNQDPKTAEINRLNGIIQKLRMDLLTKSGGGENSTVTNQEMEIMRKNLDNVMEKNRDLQHQLQLIIQDVTEVETRAVFAETAYEELCQKFSEGKKMVLDIDTNLDEQSPTGFIELSQKIKEIRKFFEITDGILDGKKQELLNVKISHSSSNGSATQNNEVLATTEIIQQKLDAHTSKQLDFNNELRQLNKELNLKEELYQKMLGNRTQLYDDAEVKMKEYESMIQILEAEKNELSDKLKCVKENVSAKIAEERRLRLQQLEKQISDLRKQNVQQAKLLKLREQERAKISMLTKQIQEMKAAKVKLIRAMKTESENFRQWKLNREKELTQLKEKDRKRQNEMTRMALQHNKEKGVLKRRVEEAMANNKRLKEILEKREKAQLQRKHITSGKEDQAIQWIDQELEIIMSVIDAKYSLEQLMELRADVNNRHRDLMQFDPDNTEEIAAVEEELQMRNAQINDLQQKIVASDIDSKIKSMCDGVQSMPELRASLKHLLTVLTSMRREVVSIQDKISEYKSVSEAAKSSSELAEKKLQDLEKEFRNIKSRHREEIGDIEKCYEEKLTVLLREINNAPKLTNGEITPETDERMKIQQELLDKLDSVLEELNDYKVKCKDLQDQLEEMKNFKKPGIRRTQIKEEVVADEYIDFSFNDTDYNTDDTDNDPDWVKTPLIRHRKSNSSSREDNISKVGVKRSSDGSIRCCCKGKCTSKLCSCRKNETICSENCKCSDACLNKNTDEDDNSDENVLKEKQNIDSDENSPKKPRISEGSSIIVTTPLYPYSNKKRKPFFN